MIDLFKLCGLARRFDDGALERALAGLPDDGRGHRAAVAAVLGDGYRRARYERLHLQCRAVAGALDALDRDGAADRHGWRDRLADFADAPDADEAVRRVARAGPTGDAAHVAPPAAPADEPVRPENMSWEQYLAWLESMRRRGHEKRDVGPDEGDCVMSSVGPFRVDDANAGDGMSVVMSDVEGRVVTVHWNSLSHPIEFEGRRYFHVVAR